MHTPSGEALKDNTSPLLMSATYLDCVWAKAIVMANFFASELTDSPIRINHLHHPDTLIVLNYLSLN